MVDTLENMAGTKPRSLVEPNVQQGSPRLSLQDALNEVVWFHGGNPAYWSTIVYQGLAAKGIAPEDITRRRLALAQQYKEVEMRRRLMDERLGKPIRAEYTIPSDATREQVISRLKQLREERLKACEKTSDESAGYQEAINQESKVSATTALKVKENEFRSMLRAMGLNETETSKWGLKKLNRKVASQDELSKLIQDTKLPPEGGDLVNLQNIADVLAEGGVVEVVSEEPVAQHETNGEDSVITLELPTLPTDNEVAPAEPKKRVAKVKAPKQPRGMSLKDAGYEVMKAGEPGKAWSRGELMEAIEKSGLWTAKKGKTPEASLVSSMYVEIDKGGEKSRFAKGPERGTFVLKS